MSAAILRDHVYIENSFRPLGDEEPLPIKGDVVVSLQRYLEERPKVNGRLGVHLESTADALALAGALDDVSLVTVSFPKYNDGRGYTHAFHLREVLGYGGELRAVGDVGSDHLFNMRRVGFDSFALREGEDRKLALRSLQRYSLSYQPTAWTLEATDYAAE